jgi:hypothetical protein
MKKNIGKFILIIFLAFFGASVTHAVTNPANDTLQSINDMLIGKLDISVSPQYPGPEQTVTLVATNYSTDLSRATISWYIGGRLMKSGTGEKEMTFTTGKLGPSASIRAVASTVEKNTISGTIIVRPSAITLNWEADTFTPPFYKGKALPAPGGKVKVVALPHVYAANGEVGPSRLLYKWEVDGNVQTDASGYGKNVFTFRQRDVPSISRVTVTAQTLDGKAVGRSSISIDPVYPHMTLYEDHPLYGIRLDHAMRDKEALYNQEIRLIAVPYYSSPANFTYQWSVNGKEVSRGGNEASALSLSRKPEQTGDAVVSVKMNGSERIFQEAARSVTFQLKN